MKIPDTPDNPSQDTLETGSPLELARAAARTAIANIHRRRDDLRPRDRGIDYFPDHPDLDPQVAAVIGYVNRYRDVPVDVLLADAHDQFALLAYERVREEHLRLGVINALRKLGATWPQVAAALRLGSYQAAQQQWLRLDSGAKGGPRTERGARAARRAADVQQLAAETNEQRLRRLARTLADMVNKDLLPPAALDDSGIDIEMWAAEVAGLPDGVALTSLALSELRFMAGELVARDDVNDEVTAIATECVARLA